MITLITNNNLLNSRLSTTNRLNMFDSKMDKLCQLMSQENRLINLLSQVKRRKSEQNNCEDCEYAEEVIEEVQSLLTCSLINHNLEMHKWKKI
jgi:hypothetical protein